MFSTVDLDRVNSSPTQFGVGFQLVSYNILIYIFLIEPSLRTYSFAIIGMLSLCSFVYSIFASFNYYDSPVPVKIPYFGTESIFVVMYIGGVWWQGITAESAGILYILAFVTVILSIHLFFLCIPLFSFFTAFVLEYGMYYAELTLVISLSFLIWIIICKKVWDKYENPFIYFQPSEVEIGTAMGPFAEFEYWGFIKSGSAYAYCRIPIADDAWFSLIVRTDDPQKIESKICDKILPPESIPKDSDAITFPCGLCNDEFTTSQYGLDGLYCTSEGILNNCVDKTICESCRNDLVNRLIEDESLESVDTHTIVVSQI